jgi:hypothetical protein
VMIEERGRSAGQGTLQAFESATDVAVEFDRLVDRRQSQRRTRAAMLAVTVVALAFAVLATQGTLSADSTPEPMKPVPGIEVGDVPVWYDDAGLHRGDVVEQTPVELILPAKKGEDAIVGALALVRSGALYSDPATDDVWFHPWGGEPRVVGHGSSAGPGGDPNGYTAAWFDGGQLVVYDTGAAEEVSRTPFIATPAACESFCVEHIRGNGFLQVSNERVTWSSMNGPATSAHVYSWRTGEDQSIQARVLDVHDESTLLWGVTSGAPDELLLQEPGQPRERHDELAHRARFSPTGEYVLSVYADEAKQSGAAILNMSTGAVWHVPKSGWPWLTWSYGNVALVETQLWKSGTYRWGPLLACDAAQQTCNALPAERPFLMPTN